MKLLVAESLYNFYLNENMQEAGKLFSEAGIPIDHHRYEIFMETFQDAPEYAGQFAKWLVVDDIDFEEVQDIYRKLVRFKRHGLELDQDIESFEDMYDFKDYLTDKLKSTRNKTADQQLKVVPDNIQDMNKNVNQSIEKITDRDPGNDIKTKAIDHADDEKASAGINIKEYDGLGVHENLYYSDDIRMPGQGLYVWTYLDQLDKKDKELKFGQYGALAGEAKTPTATIKGYGANKFKPVVIVYAVRLDNYLASNQNIHGFENALNAEQQVQRVIAGKKGYKIKNILDGVGKISSREVFGGLSIEQMIESINEVLFDTPKLQNFSMRPEQQAAHDQMVDYFNSGGDEFLLAAKMRYGKNFTVLNVAKTINAKNILFITYKPHVFPSLKDDITNHVNFDGWNVVDFKENRSLKNKKGSTNVYVSSAQLALYKKQEVKDDPNQDDEFKIKSLEGLQKNLKKLKKVHFDLIVADEYHYGTSTINFKKLLEDLNYDRLVYVSGTAMKDIAMGRFDDNQIYSWSYIEEQKQKELEKSGQSKSKKHLDMPTMNIHLMDISDEAKERMENFSEDEQFTMDKLIATNHNGTLKNKGGLKILLEQISGRGKYTRMSPYRAEKVNIDLDHTFWILPRNTKGIIAMADLMRSMPEYDDFEIIAATGNVVKDIGEVKEQINGRHRTITLSCYRFKEGVSVPEWNGVFMLDSGKSIEEYLQAIFRGQTPNREKDKDECHVFDFNPQRALMMIYEASENIDKKGDKKLTETIREFLDYAPVLDHRENKMIYVNFDEIIENFRVHGNFREKFANTKNFDLEAIDGDIISTLINIKSGKRGMKIEINHNDIETGINVISEIDAEKEKTTKEKKKSIKNIIEKIATVLSNIPEYMFNTPEREETVDDILDTHMIDRFREITGISMEDFKLWIDHDLINKTLLNRNIKYFKDAEDKLRKNPSGKAIDDFVNQHFNMSAEEGKTPIALVEEMIDKLPKELWKDPEKKFMDQCMGIGSFLIEIKERLMEGLEDKIKDPLEREKHIVEEMIYGIDIDKSKTFMAKSNINNKGYEDNLLNKDSLEINWKDMPKFDVVVGNPPFQPPTEKTGGGSGTRQKIWQKFIELGFGSLKENGWLALITPHNWRNGVTSGTHKKAQNLMWDKDIIYYEDIKSYFPDIGQSTNIDYWIIKNIPGNSMNIPKYFSDLKILPRDFRDKETNDFFESVYADPKDCYNLSIKNNIRTNYNSLYASPDGDPGHPYSHANTQAQVNKGLYDWYSEKTKGFEAKKVLIFDTAGKGDLGIYDDGTVGCGSHSFAYPVENEEEGTKLAEFINSEFTHRLLHQFAQQHSLSLPVNKVLRKIPKKYIK